VKRQGKKTRGGQFDLLGTKKGPKTMSPDTATNRLSEREIVRLTLGILRRKGGKPSASLLCRNIRGGNSTRRPKGSSSQHKKNSWTVCEQKNVWVRQHRTAGHQNDTNGE